MGRLDHFLSQLTRTKPLKSFDREKNTLKKCLGLVDLVAYGVGCSVGAGVYSLVGVGAQITGPSISLSFLVSGIACIFTSLTYSEFAARVPVSYSSFFILYLLLVG
jgi:APA family basic amino acid/polyamine antiporter